MAEIKAVSVPMGDKDFIGPTYAQLKLTGYIGNSDTGILLTPRLATVDEVDHEVAQLINAVERAGKEAKKIITSAKGRGGIK